MRGLVWAGTYLGTANPAQRLFRMKDLGMPTKEQEGSLNSSLSVEKNTYFLGLYPNFPITKARGHTVLQQALMQELSC